MQLFFGTHKYGLRLVVYEGTKEEADIHFWSLAETDEFIKSLNERQQVGPANSV